MRLYFGFGYIILLRGRDSDINESVLSWLSLCVLYDHSGPGAYSSSMDYHLPFFEPTALGVSRIDVSPVDFY